jgi:hypothetical protein
VHTSSTAFWLTKESDGNIVPLPLCWALARRRYLAMMICMHLGPLTPRTACILRGCQQSFVRSRETCKVEYSKVYVYFGLCFCSCCNMFLATCRRRHCMLQDLWGHTLPLRNFEIRSFVRLIFLSLALAVSAWEGGRGEQKRDPAHINPSCVRTPPRITGQSTAVVLQMNNNGLAFEPNH